jgi:hypothetical protein
VSVMAGLAPALTIWLNPDLDQAHTNHLAPRMDLARATLMASIKGLARAILPARLIPPAMNQKETTNTCSNSSGNSSPTGCP